jgi:GT2 family glycosyltransferase
MRQTAAIVIPTKQRPGYLQVALASIAPQAGAAKADLLVVDDAGPSTQTRELARRFGARYEPHPRPLGLNVARNTGIEHSEAELMIFVDDDVEAQPGWLSSLLDAATTHPHTLLFAGRIRAHLEGRPPRSCGRELPPITTLDLGPTDLETEAFVWGANMAARRSAFALAGPFDPMLSGGGDEQEWQERLREAGAPPALYVAGAELIHRRTPADSRLRSLSRAAYARGAQSRSFDVMRAQPPSLEREVTTLMGCVAHVVRYRCPNGITMAAHSAGRLSQALRQPRLQAHTDPPAPPDDFLSGESGEVGDLDGVRRELADRAEDAIEALRGRQRRLARAAGKPPRRRVLALGIARERHRALAQATIAELSRSRHEVEIATTGPGQRGKFENLNALLAEHSAVGHDWLIIFDDDIELPRGFLDRFVFLAERFALDLAQPAHRRASHAAWQVTRRRPLGVARETRFVEIGPLTALASSTFSTLLPFPPLRMGWGLDAHWAAVAQQQGWRCGVIDALAINHRAAPAADSYSRQQAIAEARAFLAQRPYLPAHEAQRTLAIHRRW